MRSSVWSCCSDEQFAVSVKESKSMREVWTRIGLCYEGRNNEVLKKRIKTLGLDISHFDKNFQKIASLNLKSKKELKDICVENSSYARAHLKSRILREGILKNECSICGKEPLWMGKPLVMILDHINGINNDNRIENLRLVCPDCNSQLPTFSGRNVKERKYGCLDCGKKIKKGSLRCLSCSSKNLDRRKVERPSFDQLQKDVAEMSMCAVGRKYGVSDNAIRKWLKQNPSGATNKLNVVE